MFRILSRMSTIIKTKKDAILVGQLAAQFLVTRPRVYAVPDRQDTDIQGRVITHKSYKVWGMETFYAFWKSLALPDTPKNLRIYVNIKDVVSACLDAQPRDLSVSKDGQVSSAQHVVKEIKGGVRYKSTEQIQNDLVNSYMQIGLDKARATEMTAMKVLMQSTAISQIFIDADPADLVDLADLTTLGF